MPYAFSLNSVESPPQKERHVLVTGASGNIGSYFAEHAPKRFKLRLAIHTKDQDTKELDKHGEVVLAELENLDNLKQICQGIDTVVHMAGNPSPTATWNQLLHANIIGTYNMMVAAKAAGCRRVIHASSIHAVSGYPPGVQVKTGDPVNPGDLYGVSKCFGEALGRYMAEQEGLSVIALRIGAFQPLSAAKDQEGVKMLDAFVSHRDLHQLLVRCIDDERIRFAIFNGLSNNHYKRLDITDAEQLLGYKPVDDLVDLNEALKGCPVEENMTHSAIMDGSESGLREELSK